MLRFPLRLTADLAKARIAQKLRKNADPATVLLVRPMDQESLPAPGAGDITAAKTTGTELLARVRNSSAPVVWIGGPEPLLHPEIGQLTRCIAGHGQHLFLETDGALLRRRIHEFRPVARLFLTVQLNGLAPSHNLRAGRPDAFQLALEGIRAAQLSGFLICVHIRVDADSIFSELAELLRFLETFGVDGCVISPAVGSSNVAVIDAETLKRKTAEARMLLLNRWWDFFSRQVETVLSLEHLSTLGAASAARNVHHSAGAGKESVRVT